jgi:uncharacterized membrane protein YoaT (DUF817 family)
MIQEQHLHQLREHFHSRFVNGLFSRVLFEFVTFGVKQGWACLFGGLMLVLIGAVFFLFPDNRVITRYDLITLGAISIQMSMLWFKLEDLSEARVILVFHVVGTVMEIFKLHQGSWLYPDIDGVWLQIAGVPLFSGFMYAAVGSYLVRVWRIFDFRFDRSPPLWIQAILAIAAYVNFFTHHFVLDVRNVLFVVSVLIYGPCIVWFRADQAHRPMPLALGLVLAALFIWIAENIGTYVGAWAYPGQMEDWTMVSLSKLGSWYLLMLISFVLAASVYAARPLKVSD